MDLLNEQEEPAVRMTEERARAFIAALQLSLSSSTVSVTVSLLAMTLREMCPDASHPFLAKMQVRLRAIATPARDKRQGIVSASELFQLGLKVMARSETFSGSPLRATCAFRDGLIIALLAARPLRRSNFVAIEIGRHLICQSSVYFIRFEGHETKTGKPLSCPFPSRLEPYLNRYIQNYRPILLDRFSRLSGGRGWKPAGDHLWVSSNGTALLDTGLYEIITHATQDEFGHCLSPHMFRHCAATSIALETPENVGITSAILGHSGLATSEKYYNFAYTVEAGRRYSDTVQSLRNAAVKTVNRRR